MVFASFSHFFMRVDPHLSRDGKVVIFVGGVGIVIFALRGMLFFFLHHTKLKTFSKSDLRSQILHKKHLLKGSKIVVVGGGTGLSVLLRGLKKFTSNITAIVTVADDGGSSGILREDLGMLPPGDIRNCILALADMEPTMEKLLNYRFSEGNLKGQNFGNLFIASMNEITGNFEDAIKEMTNVLAVTGKVLPVSLENITLYAKLENGKVIKGESDIPLKSKEMNSRIDRVFIKPKYSKPLEEALKAIDDADIVVLGPGSLYTSVIPNLLIERLRKQISECEASKVYITNIMTQPGETDGYTVMDHVNALMKHNGNLHLDCVIANNGGIPDDVREKYLQQESELVIASEKDRSRLREMDIHFIEENLVDIRKDYIRHDNIALSKIILSCKKHFRRRFAKRLKKIGRILTK